MSRRIPIGWMVTFEDTAGKKQIGELLGYYNEEVQARVRVRIGDDNAVVLIVLTHILSPILLDA